MNESFQADLTSLTGNPSTLYTHDQVQQIITMIMNQLPHLAEQFAPAHLENSISGQSSLPNAKAGLSIKEAAEYVGISKPSMYEIVNSGRVPSVHVGTRIVVSRQGLDDWLLEGD